MSLAGATQDVENPDCTPQKKSPLDNLSRDDLLKKCKSLLTISQKAKQAKDDAVEEVKKTKHQLNICLQESEKLKSDNEKLKSRVNTIADEKTSVLSAIENVKSNNLELQNLVRSISAERDAFFQDVERLNTEKQKLIKVVDMIGQENDANMAENRNLKEDKRKLNEELDNSQSDREVIESEIKEVKLKLVYLLNNSFALLKSFEIDVSPIDAADVESGKKFTGVICDLISKLDKNLTLTIDALSKPVIEKSSIETSSIVSKECQTPIAEVDKKSTVTEVTTELDLEISELKGTLAELEPRLVTFERENKDLKDELNVLKTQAEETSTLLIDNSQRAEDLMDELENCRALSSKKTKEISHLKDEIDALMDKNKKQAFNAMEMKGVRNENEELKAVSTERLGEVNALKKAIEEMEVSNCQLSLHIGSLNNVISDKEEEVTKMKEEKCNLEKNITSKMAVIEKLEKDIVDIKKDVEVNLSMCTSEKEELIVEMSNLRKVVEEKERELTILKDGTKETEKNSSKHTSDIETLHSELSKLKKLIEERESEIVTLKKEREDVIENDAKWSAEVEKQTVELSSVRRALDEKNVEIETTSESIKELEANSMKYSFVINSFKNEIAFLQKMVNPDSKEDSDEENCSTESNIVKCSNGIAKLKIDVTNLHTLMDDIEMNSLKFKSMEAEYKTVLNDISYLLSLIEPRTAETIVEETDNMESNILKKCSVGINSLHSEINHLRRSLEEKESEITSVKRDSSENMLKCVSEMETLKTELSRVQESLRTEASEEERKLDNVTTQLKSELSTLKQGLEVKDEEVTKLKLIIEELNAQVTKSHSDIEQLNIDLSKLKEALEERISQISVLNRNNSELATKSDSEINVLRNDISNLQKSIEIKDQEVLLIKEGKKQIEIELRGLQHFLEEREQEILKLSEDNGEYRMSLLKHSSEIETLNVEISGLKDLLEMKENEIKSVLETAREENSSSESLEVNSLRNRIIEVENLLKLKQSELDEVMAKHAEQIQSMAGSISELREVNGKKETEIETLNVEMRGLKELLETKVTEIESILEKSGKDSLEFNSVKKKITEIENLLKLKQSELDKVMAKHAEQVQSMTGSISELQEVNAKKETEIETLNVEMRGLKELLERKETEIKSTLENSGKDSLEVDSLKNKITENENLLKSKQSELDEVMAKHAEQVHSMTGSISELQEVNGKKTSEIGTLMNELQQASLNARNAEKEHTEQLRVADERYGSKRDNLTDELVNVQNASAEIEATLGRVRHELETLRAVQADFNAAKRENGELLGEMNEMNQVLKQRGETVSKLKELTNDLEQKLKVSAEEVAALTEQLGEHQKAVEEIDRLGKENEKAVDEINRLRSKVQQMEREMRDHGETASEAMSCSTLGRAEESSRLRDVEDSFEDRYTKLRVIAVRLKKRNSELAAQVAAADADKVKITADLQTKNAQLTSNAKNVQTIQQEYDKLQDLHDLKAKELKDNQKLLEATLNDSMTVKVALNEANEKLEETSNDMAAAAKSRTTLESKLKELTAEILVLRSERTEQDRQAKRLADEVSRAELRLKEESLKLRRTTEQLDAKKQEAKKNSVRCLEINDYEKSVAELADQLAAEKAKVTELNGQLDNQREIIDGLNEQIKLMEESLAAEESRSTEVIDQLNVLRLRLSEATVTSADRDVEVSRLRGEVELHREEAERGAVHLSHLAADKLKNEEVARLRVDALTQQVRQLDDEVKSTSALLSERASELSAVRAEFDGYKVRAQSVLRHQKGKPEEAASDGVEEMAQLRHAADATKAALEETRSKLSASSAELASLHQDRDRMLAKCRELADKVANLTASNQQLADKARERAAEQRDAAGKQKIHYEIIVQNYKTRLEEMEERAAADSMILKDQIAALETRLRAQETRAESGRSRSGRGNEDGRSWANSGAAFAPVRRSPDSLMMQEREEGEGSESVDSLSPHLHAGRERHELVPLDKLLASGNDDQDATVGVLSASPRVDAMKTRERLSVSDRQVQHLAALLAEAEQDLARLTQLNDVLKEEIRRNQRSVEREQHAHNQEYLKNIVFKFVTLQGGDERSRLVPVLNTILKLSPEEAGQLAAVAKGAPEGGNKGWGSYLGL